MQRARDWLPLLRPLGGSKQTAVPEPARRLLSGLTSEERIGLSGRLLTEQRAPASGGCGSEKARLLRLLGLRVAKKTTASLLLIRCVSEARKGASACRSSGRAAAAKETPLAGLLSAATEQRACSRLLGGPTEEATSLLLLLRLLRLLNDSSKGGRPGGGATTSE